MSGPERIAPAYHPESARPSWLCNPKRRVAGFSESQNTHSSKVGVSGAPEDLFSVAGCQLAISRVGMENSLSEHPFGPCDAVAGVTSPSRKIGRASCRERV